MTDVSAGTSSASTPKPSTAISRPGGNGGALQSEKGQTTIADPVVTKVAGIAAREVGGVYELGGGVARAMGAVTNRLPGSSDSSSQGVSVEVGEKEAAVDLKVGSLGIDVVRVTVSGARAGG